MGNVADALMAFQDELLMSSRIYIADEIIDRICSALPANANLLFYMRARRRFEDPHAQSSPFLRFPYLSFEFKDGAIKRFGKPEELEERERLLLDVGLEQDEREGAVRLEDYFANAEEYAPRKDAKRLDGFSTALLDISRTEDKKSEVSLELFRYDVLQCPTFRKTLSASRKVNVNLSFGHGDLNANNIFIDKSGGLALIDFEYAGIDHCFKDFISLESSLRLEFKSPSLIGLDLMALIEIERMTLSNLKGAAPANAPEYLAEITKVRSAAMSRFTTEPPFAYQIALGLHNLKLLGISGWSYDQKKALCAAAFASGIITAEAVASGL